MTQYATATELAGFLQKDLDTYSANQALTLVTGEFIRVAGVPFHSVTTTFVTTGTSSTLLRLPFRQITAVSAVRLNSTVITGVTLYPSLSKIYRALGFGDSNASPPDMLEVDLTYGFTSVTDDVKEAILESGALAYETPLPVRSETIGAYSVTYGGSSDMLGPHLSPAGMQIALSYRLAVFA